RRHHRTARRPRRPRGGRRRGARPPRRRRHPPRVRGRRTRPRPRPLHLAARRRRRRARPPPGPRRTRAPEGGGLMTVHPPVTGHCDALADALVAFRAGAPVTARWGERLAEVLTAGGRLLAAGNGGSAAQAQHLTAELVGRYRDDRPAFSAIALHADTSSTTAIANDYGVDAVFARQVRAHGRPGDVLMLLSTSGASANLLSAADAARAAGLRVWALTGPAPNPLMAGSDESL